MKLVAFLFVAPLLGACIMHIHVHEASRPAGPQAEHVSAHPSHALAVGPESVSGIVRNIEGVPVRARVAAVGEGGSVSGTTDNEGRFALPQVSWPDLVLNASTEDGRIAVLRSRPGASDVELILRAGGTLLIDLAGKEKARCAIFAGDLRIEDFGLKESERVRVVVPLGEVRVRMYEGDRILQERNFSVAAGKTESASFQLQS